MEIYERVRFLRKNVLKMSQTDFGKCLGVSRSEINNIERNALARPDQKLSLMKLIAREFNVREEWLLTGEEPMKAPPETFSLDTFCKERGASELEIEFVRAYFSLSDATRTEIMENFSTLFSGPKTRANVAVRKEPDESPAGEQYTEEEIEERVEAYRALLKREQRMKRQFETERKLFGDASETWTDPNVTGGKASNSSAG